MQADQPSMEAIESLINDKVDPLLKATQALQGSMAEVSKRLLAAESKSDNATSSMEVMGRELGAFKSRLEGNSQRQNAIEGNSGPSDIEKRVAAGERRVSAIETQMVNLTSTFESVARTVATIPSLFEAVRSSTDIITAVKAELGSIYTAANGLRDTIIEKVNGLREDSNEMRAIISAGVENWTQIPGLLEAARSSDMARDELRDDLLEEIGNLRTQNIEIKTLVAERTSWYDVESTPPFADTETLEDGGSSPQHRANERRGTKRQHRTTGVTPGPKRRLSHISISSASTSRQGSPSTPLANSGIANSREYTAVIMDIGKGFFPPPGGLNAQGGKAINRQKMSETLAKANVPQYVKDLIYSRDQTTRGGRKSNIEYNLDRPTLCFASQIDGDKEWLDEEVPVFSRSNEGKARIKKWWQEKWTDVSKPCPQCQWRMEQDPYAGIRCFYFTNDTRIKIFQLGS